MSDAGKTAYLIANLKSGKGKCAHLPEIAQKVCDELGFRLVIYTGQDKNEFEANIKKAAKSAKDDGGILLAAGGDGTVRGVAEVAAAEEVRFGVIAMGTFNFFARNYGLPEDPEEALRVALTAPVRSVRLGEVNGRVFLINASVGMYARSISEREANTDRFGRRRIVATISTIKSLLAKHRSLHVRLETDKSDTVHKTPMIFIGNNYVQLKNLSFDVAECLKAGKLAVVLFKQVSRMATLRILLRTLMGQVESEPDVDSFCVASMTITTSKKSHEVALDGELFHMATPLEVKVLPKALKLASPHREGEA